MNQVRLHANLGHGLAAQAVRAMGRAGTKVGPAENVAGKDAPKFTAEDMKIIGPPVDFVGNNVYIPTNRAVAARSKCAASPTT